MRAYDHPRALVQTSTATSVALIVSRHIDHRAEVRATGDIAMGDDVRAEELASDDPRTAAIARLNAKRHLAYKAGSFAVLTVFFVAIWAISGAGYFWPAWIMLGFAFALAGELWSFYGRKRITEDDIQREMAKTR
jgi:hypothetical protein